MTHIKEVDAQNILNVCELTNSIGKIMKGHSCCNTVSLAKAKYNPGIHSNVMCSLVYLCIECYYALEL